MDENVVGIAVDGDILESLFAGSGGDVEEFEHDFAAAAAKLLEYLCLRGVRHDHCAQGGSARNLALGEKILVYLGGVAGAGARDFFQVLGRKGRQAREVQLALVEEALPHAAATEGDEQDRSALTQQLAETPG